MKLRFADEADCKQISQLYALEAWQTFTPELVKTLMAHSTYLVLEHDGSFVGFVRYLTDGHLTTFVSELLVATAYRRQGLAGRLLMEITRQHPKTRLELISQADDCYDALGFRRVGTGFRYKTKIN